MEERNEAEEKNADKRVIKTRRAIRDALMTILETKPIKEITISELAEKASINRKTFYAHYSCPEDVIAELEDELVQSIRYFLRSDMITETGLGPQYFIQFVNAVYTSNPTFCENLVSVRNYAFLADKIKNALKEELLVIPSIKPADPVLISSMVEFFAGGVTSLYVAWIRGGKRFSFQQMTQLAIAFTIEGIGAAFPKSDGTRRQGK